jgi:hypothetical protein
MYCGYLRLSSPTNASAARLHAIANESDADGYALVVSSFCCAVRWLLLS